jgi:hypothetical protein
VPRNGERGVIRRSSRGHISRFLVVLCSKASHEPEQSAANATAGRREEERALDELAPLKVHPLGGDFACCGDITDVRHRGLYLLSKSSNRRKIARRKKVPRWSGEYAVTTSVHVFRCRDCPKSY